MNAAGIALYCAAGAVLLGLAALPYLAGVGKARLRETEHMDTATFEITLPAPALLAETRTAHHIQYLDGALLLWDTQGALSEVYPAGTYVHVRRISGEPQ